MSFSQRCKTLRNGNSYDSRTQPERSAHEDETTVEVETRRMEINEENSMRFFPDLADDGIKASLEPHHAQITALAEMMDHSIQSNPAQETITVSSGGTRRQYESPYTEVPGSARFPTVATLTRTRTLTTKQCYSTETEWQNTRNKTNDVTEQCKNINDAITTLPNKIQNTNTNDKLLHIQVPTFRGSRNRFNEFEHMLRNQLRTTQQLTYRRGETSIFPERFARRGDRIFSVTNNIHGDNSNRYVG